MNDKIHFTEPGAGEPLNMIDGVHTVKVAAEHTGGAYEVFEIEALPGPAAPPHAAPWSGTCYVLEGSIEMHLPDKSYSLAPGASITVPAGTHCTFEVTSESAKFLAFTTGDGAGKFFADFAREIPADRPLPEVLPIILRVIERHGVTVNVPAAAAGA